MSEPTTEPGVHVIVDDQLALLSILGLLILPEGVRGTLATPYTWQLRITQALVSERPTKGSLHRLVELADITRSEALARVTRSWGRLRHLDSGTGAGRPHAGGLTP